jgi:hypothetical protein
MMPSRAPARLVIAVVALGIGAAPLAPQSAPVGSISVSAGSMAFDVSGTGTAPTAALRADRALIERWLLAEIGLGYAPIKEQFRVRPTRLGMLDAQLQLQLPTPHVRPYVGMGTGAVAYLTQADGRESVAGGVSLAAGLRASLTRRLGLRAEGRLRYWDYSSSSADRFVNSAGEITAGLSRQF